MTSKIPFAIIPLSRFEIVSSTAPLSFRFSRPSLGSRAGRCCACSRCGVCSRCVCSRCGVCSRCDVCSRCFVFSSLLWRSSSATIRSTRSLFFMPEIFLSPLAFARSRKTTADKLSYFSLIHSLLFLSICYFPLCSQSYWESCLN